MLTIGCHLSTEKGFFHMAEEIVSIYGNTFQYFTRNPRGGAQKELDIKDIEKYKAYAKEHGIDVIMGYAPYTVEPVSSRQSTRDFTLMVLSEDLARAEEIPGQFYLVRPGSAPDISRDEAISNVHDAFNKTLSESMTTRVLLDTMSGEGHQVGRTFEELAEMLSGIKLSDKMGICIDTSAIWAMGYDIVGDLDGVLDDFDRAIGLDKLYAMHLNDSKEKLGSHVDRHTRIGDGQIGFEALAEITKSPRLQHVSFYLEEYDSTLVVYEKDIARFRDAYNG